MKPKDFFIQRAFVSIVVPYTEQWHKLPEFTPWPWPSAAEFNNNAELRTVAELHYHNLSVWHHEDYARSGVPEKIVAAKKGIDTHNQLRNNAIEEIDWLIFRDCDASYSSETPVITENPGSIIDRISVTYLKIYHYRELSIQQPENAASWGQRIEVLTDQLLFLLSAGSAVYDNILSGSILMKLFKQHKTYNSPDTNLKMPKP